MTQYRHKKRGTLYELVGYGEMQTGQWSEPYVKGDGNLQKSVDMAKVVIYRSLSNGALYVRPVEEFEDGRFEVIS